jgi:hypothetical protein
MVAVALSEQNLRCKVEQEGPHLATPGCGCAIPRRCPEQTGSTGKHQEHGVADAASKLEAHRSGIALFPFPS